jgi:hypothetical protein
LFVIFPVKTHFFDHTPRERRQRLSARSGHFFAFSSLCSLTTTPKRSRSAGIPVHGRPEYPPQTRRQCLGVKWIPQGWQWVDPLKEIDAMKAAIRSGLMSRSEAISSNGYDAEDMEREIAADNARADGLGQ